MVEQEQKESPNHGPPLVNGDLILYSSDIDASSDEHVLLIANEHRQRNYEMAEMAEMAEMEEIMDAVYYNDYPEVLVKNNQRTDTAKELVLFLPNDLVELCNDYVMCKCPGKCEICVCLVCVFKCKCLKGVFTNE
jgi:hypothetical protein